MKKTEANVGMFAGLQEAHEAPGEVAGTLRQDEADTDFSVLQLVDGENYALRKQNPKYKGWVEFIYASKPRDPMYVETEPGTRNVKSLLGPLPRRVQYVAPELEEGRLDVILLMCPSVCYLNPDLGEEKFKSFREQLEYAMRSKDEVLVTTRPATMEILDVRPLEGRASGYEENPNGPAAIEIETPEAPGRGEIQALAATAPISLAEATAEFDKLAAQVQIPFAFLRDCCTGRAHEMCRIMKLDGFSPRKVWNYGHGWAQSRKRPTLRVETNGVPEGFVKWSYHVAPIIPVHLSDGTIEEMVLDPSLFTTPVTIDEWVAKQEDLTRETRKRTATYIWFDYLNGETLTDSRFTITYEQFRSHRAALNDEQNS